jgi:hypothetical protein
MATMTITIDDAQVSRVIEALCVTAGVAPANAANARQVVRDWVKRTTLEYERRRDSVAAVQALPTPVDPAVT